VNMIFLWVRPPPFQHYCDTLYRNMRKVQFLALAKAPLYS
jgi:hypothetical protein